MSSIFHFEIKETQEELFFLLRLETNVRKKERLQFLYWYKSGLVTSRKTISGLLGKSLPVITKWMKRYTESGLKGLLTMDYQGRKASRRISDDAIEELVIKLEQPEGFGSYQEIQTWLKEEYNIEVAYSTVHKVVKYNLNASPKVARPISEKHNSELVEDFKKNLSNSLNEIKNICLTKYAKIRYWVQDESRISLKTWLRRRITKCGVKPVMKTKGNRAGYSLYGAVEVKTGESFFWEGEKMNEKEFEKFLKDFSNKNPTDFYVVQLDQDFRFSREERI